VANYYLYMSYSQDRPSRRSSGSSYRGYNNKSQNFSRRNRSNRSGGGSGGGFRRGRGRFQAQRIDHSKYVKAAVMPEPQEAPKIETREFKEFDLHPKLMSNIQFKGFTKATPIQDKVIEGVQTDRDVLGIADTGTGKTGAFLIPLIDNWLKEEDTKSQALVIAPTRELANQIEQEFISLAHHTNLWSACIVGGTSMVRQIRRLKKHNHLVVGTPGRLVDLINQGVLKPDNFKYLVLDEVDRMLDMGFIEDIQMIHQWFKEKPKTLFFSATLEDTIKRLTTEFLDQPLEAFVSSGKKTSENIEQDIVKVHRGEDREAKLLEILNRPEVTKAIIFSQTKRGVENVYDFLRSNDQRVEFIHGDNSQRHRFLSLDKFKKGRVNVLVATDVAARGIDVKDISHVINFEEPSNYQDYIHRIGRTGRAGKMGYALTFVQG
jgi:ATP-dependent RNA helicase RhlE